MTNKELSQIVFSVKGMNADCAKLFLIDVFKIKLTDELTEEEENG